MWFRRSRRGRTRAGQRSTTACEPANSLLVFATLGPPILDVANGCLQRLDDGQFTVTHAFDLDLDLEADQRYFIGGDGCRVGDRFDRSVVAMVDPPTVIDDRGEVRRASRAWSYSLDGLRELDPTEVTCELESG